MATLLTGLRDIAATVQIGYNAILGCPLDPVGRGDGFRALTAEFYTPLDQPVWIPRRYSGILLPGCTSFCRP